MHEQLGVALRKARQPLHPISDLLRRRAGEAGLIVEPLDGDAAIDLGLPVVARLADADGPRPRIELIPVARIAARPLGRSGLRMIEKVPSGRVMVSRSICPSEGPG